VTQSTKPSAGRRAGYVAAILVNAIGLFIVQNLPEWDISFVTSDFRRVDGVISFSLVVTMVVNTCFILYDDRWFKGLGEAVSNAVSALATVRLLRVFPFDFSEWDGPWETVARAVLILALIGTVVAIIGSVRNLVLGLGELRTSP